MAFRLAYPLGSSVAWRGVPQAYRRVYQCNYRGASAAKSGRVHMNLDAGDMVEAVSDLLKHGYEHEYRIRDGGLYDLTADRPVAAGDVHVDAALRFESAPDAGDGSNVYAIAERKARSKGLLIDAFDALDRDCSRELYERLNTNRRALHDTGGEIASRYGLRKVFKEEFEADPERFVLRIAFPDFPPCPYGQSFSMLGFDTAEQAYVWLVTSILRDARLERVPYQGADVPDNE
ncbi:hypothetical protein LB561_13205 [Mesorhizobium sp. B292B1B]|uniref:hypothetical protein n=1 Tax=unclassified Mesorhizobium TaxID=325217 RepID=UPI001CD17582|nr:MULTISPECIES: hypothetical protein [unclassified Mesorhizobium]MCA0011978.1 hypothetical protein [Mesorhizobium sp. B294B1A1]MCA0038232.1 hypothetical protein [Mesorhizobium sp. B292B1B]